MKGFIVLIAVAAVFLFTGASSAQVALFWGGTGPFIGPRADQSNVFGEGPFHYGQYAGLGRSGVGDLYSQTNECRLFYHTTAALRDRYKAKTTEYDQALNNLSVPREQVARLKAEAENIYDEILKNGPRRNFPCPW